MNTNQTIAEQTIANFQQQEVTVSANSFFGIPIPEYFGGEKRSKTASVTPHQIWEFNPQPARQMVAELEKMGIVQTKPTFFGIPIPEFFSRSDNGVWQQILDDLTPTLQYNAPR